MKSKLNYRIIGKRIKETREINNLTQEELAERADLSKVFIAYIEIGKRKPSLESIVKISQALDTSIDNILISNTIPTDKDYQLDLSLLLIDCTNYEKRIIIDTIKSLKTSFTNNRELKP